MTDREKNLIFCALLLIVFVLVGGLNLTDINLNRMLLPSEEIRTVSIRFDHGVTFKAGGQEWRPAGFSLLGLTHGDGMIYVSLGGREKALPRYLTLEALSTWLRLTN